MQASNAAAERGIGNAARKYDLLSPADLEREFTIPESTQAVWRCTNRLGFGDLVIRLGRSIRYNRSDIERWVESRRATALADQ